MKGWPCIAVPQGSAHPINNSEFRKPTPDGGWHLHYVVLQDHLGNLQWPSQDLSSFLHETILSIHVGWVPMIHLHEKMKVVQQSDFFSMSLFENRQAGIFFHTRTRQDHTSQDHFCSVISEFPVWNSKSFKPRWWDKVSHPEREAVQKIQFFWTLMIACFEFYS